MTEDTRGRVVHVNSGFDYDLYVGRANKRYGLEASEFVNPFKVGQKTSPNDKLTREQAISLFGDLMRQKMENEDGFWEKVASLRGLTLACWCAPKGESLTADDPWVCHAQVLHRLAQELTDE